MSDQDPREEGKLAASNHEPRESNHYPNDSEEHEEWNSGFDYVDQSDEDGEPKEDD